MLKIPPFTGQSVSQSVSTTWMEVQRRKECKVTRKRGRLKVDGDVEISIIATKEE